MTTLFVTGGGDPEVVPAITNCDIVPGPRPSILRFLINFLRPSISRKISYEEFDSDALFGFDVNHCTERMPWTDLEGVAAVCTSGPINLTTDVANAVAKVRL